MNSKIQSVSFRNVDEFLDYLTVDELKIVKLLRNIIFEGSQHITEKLSYNVPFYKIDKTIFFIWPTSILWGKTKSYEGVRHGFTSGYLMQDELNYLDKGNRKIAYYRDFSEMNILKEQSQHKIKLNAHWVRL